MDLGLIRGLGTAALLLSFLVYCVWVWSPAQRSRFEEASRLPFADEENMGVSADTGRKSA